MPAKKTKSVKNFKIIIVACVAVLVLLAVFYFFARPKVSSGVPAPTPSSTVTYYSQLDGSVVSGPEKQVPQVLGVMIDNHPAARPVAGLAEARIVYEAMAEGGITRYLALFAADQTVAKVGPVRSARPYYMDWMAEYGVPAYLHCGGSPMALTLLKTIKTLVNVDQFFKDHYFWRADDRDAPHNLYTSSALWQKMEQDYHLPTTTWSGWMFNHGTSTIYADSTSVQSASIRYGTSYAVTWNYDPTIARYVRSINGVTQADESGMVVKADTVILQEVATQVIDDDGRKEMDTIGSGLVRVLEHGQLIRGVWKKTSATGRTKFYTNDDQEIALDPGQIWVQIMPAGTNVVITN